MNPTWKAILIYLICSAVMAAAIYERYSAERIAFYHKLAANPGQLQFLKSWLSRIKPYA